MPEDLEQLALHIIELCNNELFDSETEFEYIHALMLLSQKFLREKDD